MNRNEFELKLKEAGFESGAEFAKKLKILRASVTEWHKYKYPEYVECVLNYIIQVRKIDLIKKNNDINAFLKEKIQLYKKENWVLEDKIKELKAVLNEKMTREEFDALIEKCNIKTYNKIIDENYNEKMTREEFDALIEKCNIKTYIELANILNINPQTIFNWNKEATYPKYLKQLLEWLVLIREYNDNNKIKFQEYILEYSKEHNEQFKQIQQKNLELKQRLEDCKLMKKVLESKLKSQL